MEQSANDAAAQDAQIKLREEEYVEDTEHTATPMMNLQLMHHHALGQNLRKQLQRILVSVIQVPRRAKAAYLRR